MHGIELRVHDMRRHRTMCSLQSPPGVSREPLDNMGSVKDRMLDGTFFKNIAMPTSFEDDRFMVCGSPQMLADLCQIMDEWSFREGNSSRTGQFVIERAVVDK
jgi:ferredoxin--NADP+ reductase